STSQDGPDRLSDFALHLPVYVVGSLLGVPADMLHQVALWVGDFVRCLAPASSFEQIERGKEASKHLLNTFCSLLTMYQSQPADNLLAALAREAKRVGCEDTDSVIANGIGFLSQAYEATAGLVGNTLLALAAHAEVQRMLAANPALLSNAVQEVLRYDPPVQNT